MDYEYAKEKDIKELYDLGRASELPYKDMELTTVVAEAARMVRLENAPDFFKLPITAFSIGKIAFFGIEKQSKKLSKKR